MSRAAPLACAITLGACLLFQIQFLLARQILPWFGGSPAVWSTSLVVFQVLLLAGYAWAHGLARLPSKRWQAGLQAALVIAGLGVVAWHTIMWPSPVMPGANWKPVADQSPIASIAVLLVATIGVPFLTLASTSPLLQRWHAAGVFTRRADTSTVGRTGSPYRWYAASNAGSLVGLLSYPLVVEPNLDLLRQGRWWSLGYVAFAAAMLACAWMAGTDPGTGHRAAGTGTRPDTGDGTVRTGEQSGTGSAADARGGAAAMALAAVLAAVPAALLQATTTLLTQDIAAVPFLWMLPLAVYLLTFIVAFERPAVCPRAPLAIALAIGGLLSIWRGPAGVALVLALATMAVAGLALHGELARRAPPADRLTRYYLAVAAGGAGGSALVAFGAPLTFARVIEYPVTLVAALVTLALVVWSDRHTSSHPQKQRLLAQGLMLAALVLTAATDIESRLVAMQTTHASRSFFGTVRVRDLRTADGAHIRHLIHGTTLHGMQILDDNRRLEPTAYFRPTSGIGRAMAALRARREPLRVVVVGLGIGTLAAYGREGDRLTFIEIDPQVAALSAGPSPAFTFLRQGPATTDIVVGDGRLVLEQQPPLHADLLVVDAFSSDAVPVHLITVEALGQYERHLRDARGLIAIHVSNRYLDLVDVAVATAHAHGLTAVHIEDAATTLTSRASDWVLLARDPASVTPFGAVASSNAHPWTDTWSAPWQARKR
ncbi:MAG: fused MFS/spermidine synthase [Acidobacteria bacterium]|nr:fused MFS/spermidine synthase [Acidobacteriota bacterium]